MPGPLSPPDVEKALQEPPPDSGSPRRRTLRVAGFAALVLVAVSIVAALYISPYSVEWQSVPAGYDTPWYIWRAKLVAAEGFNALPGTVAPPARVQAYRAGHPLLAGFLDSVIGIDPYQWTFAISAVTAVVFALGAGVFAVRALREPRWAFPIYVVALGASVNIAQIAGNKADNMLVNALIIGVATLAITASGGGRGAAGSALLLAAAAVCHWTLAVVFVLLLGAVAAALLPGSLAARRRGTPLKDTPFGRLALLLGGSVAAGGAALLLTPEPPGLPRTHASLHGVQNRGPRFLPMVPLVPFGVPALLFPRDARRRRALLLTLVWAAPGLVGLLAFLPIGDRPHFFLLELAPPHRVLPLALGMPLLAAAALVGAVRLLGRIRPVPVGWILGAAVVLLVLPFELVWARDSWSKTPFDQAAVLQQSQTAARYLAQVGGDAPVVFITSNAARRDPGRIVRAGLLPDQIPRAYAYIGTTENLLAGRPTFRTGNVRFNDTSARLWQAVKPLLDEDPIILSLWALNPDVVQAQGTGLAPGLTLIRGPTPSTIVQPSDLTRPSIPGLAFTAALSLLFLTVVGLGWSVALAPGGWLERVSLAPALGISVLILGGLLAARVGADAPGARPVIAVALTVLPWVPSAVRWVRARRPSNQTSP